MMKKCTICKVEKELNEFNNKSGSKDGKQTQCRDCGHKRFKAYYEKNKIKHRAILKKQKELRRESARNYIVDYLKTHPCLDCGITDIRVLEFDHLPEFEKRDGVAALATAGYALSVVKDEIEKCEVRCRNCHTIKTYERLGGSWHDNFLDILE